MHLVLPFREISLVQSLTGLWTGRIVISCKENWLAYDRPKLSKAMSIKPDKIYLRPAEFYKNYDIEVLLGNEVVSACLEILTVWLLDVREEIRFCALTATIDLTMPTSRHHNRTYSNDSY